MALVKEVIWEVRGATGSDNNGGGFNSAAAGTDYSTSSSSPHVVIDGATITLTVQAVTTSVKLVGYTVASTDVGNIVNINGGTMTAGRYLINTVTTGASNFWNLDRSAGTSTQTGTGNMGGALATIQTAVTATTVGGMWTYVKADGTYSITAAIAISGPSGAPSYASRIIGYTSSRSDLGRVTLIVGAGAGINAFTTSSNAVNWSIENFSIDGTATSGSQGLIGISFAVGGGLRATNCKVFNFANEGIKGSGSANYRIYFCEVTGCAGTTAAVDAGGNDALRLVYGCYIHDNTKVGVNVQGTSTNAAVCDSIIANNTGASSDGITIASSSYTTITGNLLYGNGRDGVRLTSGNMDGVCIMNNLFAKNSGIGLNLASAVTPTPTVPNIDYNGYWSNSGGAVANFTQSSHDVNITGTDPTNDPFVAKGSANWALNNTAGAGTLLRGVGFAGAFPGLATPVGARDIGPYQHQYPSSIVIINE